MTYKAIIIFKGYEDSSVQEVILVPENASKAILDAVVKKIEWVECSNTIVCKSVKDLESKSVLFKG